MLGRSPSLSSKEMKEEESSFIPEASTSKPEEMKEDKEESALDQEELWDIYKEIKMRSGEKK